MKIQDKRLDGYGPGRDKMRKTNHEGNHPGGKNQ